ncbi:MAG: heavy metal translocating P-type ATPase metal-binding domain-containing protein [Chitinophagaceae bacterium]
MKTALQQHLACYHCGEACSSRTIIQDDKPFCCEGCRMVFNLLNQNGLCSYYELNQAPGINRTSKSRPDKFAFLDDKVIQQRLIRFKDNGLVHINFYLPQIHCSSCLWLLEHLNRLNGAIVQTTVNFPLKEIALVYNEKEISVRKIVELLTDVGYEPYISLNDLKDQRVTGKKGLIYRVGIAGFCFANIMLLSFPEYLGMEASEGILRTVFHSVSFMLSLPVLLYCAQPFYISAFKSIKHKFLHVDAPIALAIIITFLRSSYEVLMLDGNGYFDSMSGIVFFMLIGRSLQERTYRQLSFDRDYTSYFPIAITVITTGQQVPTPLPDIKVGDTLLIHHEELIPADGILTKGAALIDYSFVTGESLPVFKDVGEIVYAGGRQTGMLMELLTIKEVSQSYLTSLWSKQESNVDTTDEPSFVNVLSRYFTYVVFVIALLSGIYWQVSDPSKTWNVVTAILIIACPCALLLANTFTNGNVLRILARNHLFLRNARAIENIAATDHIVFDKTGTLTSIQEQEVNFIGSTLNPGMKEVIASLAAQSTHPLAKAVCQYLCCKCQVKVEEIVEEPGKGLRGIVTGKEICMGSKEFLNIKGGVKEKESRVYVSYDNVVVGYFVVRHTYREEIRNTIKELKRRFRLSVLSGDNNSEKKYLQEMFGSDVKIMFHQKPHDKQEFIRDLQKDGINVMMIGDGLNDAVALKQSNTGIAVCEQTNTFTPASDGILEAGSFHQLTAFLALCRYNKMIVTGSFAFSIIYNLIGIYFALQGILSPLVAAILMPASSVTVLLLTFGTTNLIARRLKL